MYYWSTEKEEFLLCRNWLKSTNKNDNSVFNLIKNRIKESIDHLNSFQLIQSWEKSRKEAQMAQTIITVHPENEPVSFVDLWEDKSKVTFYFIL